MRRVRKDLSTPPAILANEPVRDSLSDLVRTGDKAFIQEALYQDAYQDDDGRRQMRVRDELNRYYHGKCAYCETDCKAEIEHYRPKKRVADTTHAGYYWLCYEWSNLVASCHDCNTSGGKGSQFPIKGVRVDAPALLPTGELDITQNRATAQALLDELPYLLHPELDEPDTYLSVQIDPSYEGLELTGADGPRQRGEQTIQICNLNRKNLKVNRLRVVTQLVSEINRLFSQLAEGLLAFGHLSASLTILFRQLDDNAHNNYLEHTLLRRYVVQNEHQFDSLMKPLLEPTQWPIVQAAFTKYRQSNPFTP